MNNLNDIFFAPTANQELTYERTDDTVHRQTEIRH